MTDRRRAHIRVPASTSNLGSAFDAVGLALRLYLRVEVCERDGGPSSLEFTGQDARLVPDDRSNLIWRTMEEVACRAAAPLPPFELRVTNEIPITRGLGSSAAARIAGAAAAGLLCGLEFAREDILEIAAAGEGHPDNAAAAVYGGLVASVGGDRIECSRTRFPARWKVVAVTPNRPLETELARSVLPREVSHRDAVFNVQRAAFLMTQLALGRRAGVREAMRDRLHQPFRAPLLPGLAEVLEMEDRKGLIGVALSGAGPTVVAFADACEEEIGATILEIFARHGVESEVRLLEADGAGLRIDAGGEEIE